MESEGKKRLIRVSVWVAVLSLLLAVVSSLVTALEASAHAALRSMSPAAGSTVPAAPQQVVLTFNEPISTSFATVTVTDEEGGSVASGRPVVSGSTVTQRLAPVGSGLFTVAFRVVGQDGHPVAQEAAFTVHLPAATASSDTSATGPSAPSTAPTSAPTSSSANGSAAVRSPGDGDRTPTQTVLAWSLGTAALAVAAAAAVAWRRRRQRGQ